jgi:hypothetical protein
MWTVFSDVHDNLVNLEIWAKWCRAQNIDQALFCGDLTNSETFQLLAACWPGELYFTQGNADNYQSSDIPQRLNFHNLGRCGRLAINNRIIGLCHESLDQDKVLAGGAVDVLFYGHTHKPWQEQRDGIWLVNPGTLGGVYYPASFTIYDPVNNTWELKVLQQLTS